MSKLNIPYRISAWVWRDHSGEIDIDTISESIRGAQLKKLETHMGWMFQCPDRYSQEESWERLLNFGRIVSIEITIVDA